MVSFVALAVLLLGLLLTPPLAAEAQPAGRIYRIGILYAAVPFSPESKALGLTIPPEVLARADQVIE